MNEKLFTLSAVAAGLLVGLLATGCVVLPTRPTVRYTVERFDPTTGRMASRVTVVDREGGGGGSIGMDPHIENLSFSHTNALLGSSTTFASQGITIVVSTNDAAIINALGSAVGAAAGTAVKTATGVPSVPTLTVPPIKL